MQLLLRRHGLEPKTHLGQCFLADQARARHVVATASIDRTDLVIEIGSGLGGLTRALAEVGCRVVGIEQDAGLVAALRSELRGDRQHDRDRADRRICIEQGDALALDLARFDEPVIVTGCLPAHIAAELLQWIAGQPPSVLQRAVVGIPASLARVLLAPAEPPAATSAQLQARRRCRMAALSEGPRLARDVFFPPADEDVLMLELRPLSSS